MTIQIGLLDNIDFDKYRIIKEKEQSIVLENEDTNVRPIPIGTGGAKPQPEMNALSNKCIIQFHIKILINSAAVLSEAPKTAAR